MPVMRQKLRTDLLWEQYYQRATGYRRQPSLLRKKKANHFENGFEYAAK